MHAFLIAATRDARAYLRRFDVRVQPDPCKLARLLRWLAGQDHGARIAAEGLN